MAGGETCVAGGHAWQEGMCGGGPCVGWEGMHGRGCVVGAMCGLGGHAWQGVCGGGHAWVGRACMAGGCGGGMDGWGVCMAGGCVVGACMVGGMSATHASTTLRDTVGQCAGRYASYWNAFLFYLLFVQYRYLPIHLIQSYNPNFIV